MTLSVGERASTGRGHDCLRLRPDLGCQFWCKRRWKISMIARDRVSRRGAREPFFCLRQCGGLLSVGPFFALLPQHSVNSVPYHHRSLAFIHSLLECNVSPQQTKKLRLKEATQVIFAIYFGNQPYILS